jgi:alpha-amylase
LSNSMQKEAMKRIYSLENDIINCGNPGLINIWEKLQTSDHFYYMCTKFWNDGDVHKYFSPYDSPYDAYLYYMNVFSDLECRVKEAIKKKKSLSLNTKIKIPGNSKLIKTKKTFITQEES